MSDRKLTLLELHVHSDEGVQLGPRSIGDVLGRGESTAPDRAPEPATGERSERLPGPLLAAVGLGMLVLAGVAWRVLRER